MVMSWLLTIVSGPDRGCSFPLAEGQNLLIGRGPNTETRLHDPEVSRVHCVAQLRDGKVLLTDSGSRAGTRVNGKPVTEHELKPGDLIEIGGTKLSFTWAEGTARYSTLGISEDDLRPGGGEQK
jgi:pSer/pThr/pTyr-binding forkhead associated (FHA) protein